MLSPQVQAISSAKRDSLSMAQQDAIRSVIEEDPDEEDPWGPDDDDDDDCPGTYAPRPTPPLYVWYTYSTCITATNPKYKVERHSEDILKTFISEDIQGARESYIFH